MLIFDLCVAYAAWLFAAVMFSWLGSILLRNAWNTFIGEPELNEEPPSVTSEIPARPTRPPRVPFTTAG